MRTFFIETWGCQMNLHDTERLGGQLRLAGLREAPAVEHADLVLLNTCSVREKPVQKLVSRIGALARRATPVQIGVCGCVAQQEGEALLATSPAVGFVLGPAQIPRVNEAVSALSRGERLVITGFDHPNARGDMDAISRAHPTKAMVTVVEGCDEFCTFCIVPYTRGREISRPLSEVLAEVESLACTGVPEIELLGQTINAYRCPVTGADFAELLTAVAQVDGPSRVRFVTSHPRHFDDRLISVLSAHPKVSRYLHLPVQAGADEILKKMHRRYTRAEYLDLIHRIRSAVPDINLSTDVIVGFPGEEEAHFQQSLDILEEVRFGQVFAFAYSPRPRTPASKYDGEVSEEVKKDRLHRLFALTDTISTELNRQLEGRVIDVLIDGDSRKSPSSWQGRGEDNRVVNFPKNAGESLGDIVQVRIVHASTHSLQGQRVGAPTPLPVA